MGHHVAGVLGKHLQQLVFLRGQHHARAVERDHAGGEVDGERPSLDHRLAGGGAHLPPHGGVRAREQLGHPERLDHVVVGAVLQ